MYLFSEVVDLKPARTHCISRVSAGKAVTRPERTLDIAAGANHRSSSRLNPSHGRAAEIATTIPAPLPGLAAIRSGNRWFAPLANIRNASGVRYPYRPQS